MEQTIEKLTEIIPCKVLKQHWVQKSFSYLDEPRPDCGIMLLLNGRIDFVTAEKDVLHCTAGNIIFLPQGCFYEALFLTAYGKIDNYLINFFCKSSDGFPQKPKIISENASVKTLSLFEELTDSVNGGEISEYKKRAMYYLILDSITECRAKKCNSAERTVLFAKELLESEEALSLNEIARRCAVSESGLRSIFKKATGISPAKYRLNHKLKTAVYLLESTDLHVEEIADRLLFYDAAYFCRLFKKYTGVSPKKYSQSKKL